MVKITKQPTPKENKLEPEETVKPKEYESKLRNDGGKVKKQPAAD